MAARGEGVLETFVAVVQDMLAAIAVKYNLKEKGLDPAVVPEVVAQAFSNLLKKAPRPRPPGAPRGSPARVVLAHPADSASDPPRRAAPTRARSPRSCCTAPSARTWSSRKP